LSPYILYQDSKQKATQFVDKIVDNIHFLQDLVLDNHPFYQI
jgi:hypothetical protein